MSLGLQLWVLFGAVVYLGIILWMLKHKKLNVRFSITWLISGVCLLIFAACPYVVYVLRDIFRIEMPSNLVFAMVIGFMMLILLSLSAAVTKFSESIKRLTQSVAILEKRVRELEEQLQQHSDEH